MSSTFSVRGLAMVAAGLLGVIVGILDGIDDGFSVWNAISIACFLVVLSYGYLALSNRRPSPG